MTLKRDGFHPLAEYSAVVTSARLSNGDGNNYSLTAPSRYRHRQSELRDLRIRRPCNSFGQPLIWVPPWHCTRRFATKEIIIKKILGFNVFVCDTPLFYGRLYHGAEMDWRGSCTYLFHFAIR